MENLNKKESSLNVNIKNTKKRQQIEYNNFVEDPTNVIDPNVQKYDGVDNVKILLTYLEKMNLGEIEFSVFPCKSKSKIPAYYANIKLGSTSLASSFPEKYSLPEVAKQVAARHALTKLITIHSNKNVPITQDMEVVARRLENELQKNYGGLFCDKVEDVYKEVYNESLPSNWLTNLNQLTTNIIIENLPKQNKSILYYVSLDDKKKHDDLMDTSMTIYDELPLMKFSDKTERSVNVVSVDSNHTFWILFVHDSINDEYEILNKTMNTPEETKNFIKICEIEISDIYAVQIEDEWYRFQAMKFEEEDNVTGIFIDLGIEWSVHKNKVMFLPPKFLNVPSQAIKCSLTSLFFAPYFEVANNLFKKLLFGKEFTVVPDNIEGDVPSVTLYNGKCNMNVLIMDAIIKETNFNKIEKECKGADLGFVFDGYIYIHPPCETLMIMESILDSISVSRPINLMYSKKSISPRKVYLVKCIELNMWCRAIIDDYMFTDHKFKVYFIDYGHYEFVDQDKFIDLQSIDMLLAAICPQALKVVLHLFPPDKLTESQSKALYEMMAQKSLDIEIVSTNSKGIQVVEIYDAKDRSENRVSFNTQLYQCV